MHPNDLVAHPGLSNRSILAPEQNVESRDHKSSRALRAGATNESGGLGDEEITSAHHPPDLSPLPAGQPARFLPKSGSIVDDHPLSTSRASVPATTEFTNDSKLSESCCSSEKPTELLSDSATLKPDNPSIDLPSQSPHTHPEGYNPVPINDVFSRSAAPLFLPELDEWLEKLPRRRFTHHTPTKPESLPRPFPPLDLLNGENLKDLINNCQAMPIWRDWNLIRSTVRRS